MTRFDFDLLFILCCLWWTFFLLTTAVVAWFHLDLPRRVFLDVEAFFVALVVVMALSAWLVAIEHAQLAPHHVVSYLGERKVADYWTTNRFVYQAEALDGAGFVTFRTNELWHVWGIFQ